MELIEAVNFINKLKAIPNLPEIMVIQMVGLGFDFRFGHGLSLKKNFVDEGAFFLLYSFIVQNNLELLEIQGQYIIYSTPGD